MPDIPAPAPAQINARWRQPTIVGCVAIAVLLAVPGTTARQAAVIAPSPVTAAQSPQQFLVVRVAPSGDRASDRRAFDLLDRYFEPTSVTLPTDASPSELASSLCGRESPEWLESFRNSNGFDAAPEMIARGAELTLPPCPFWQAGGLLEIHAGETLSAALDRDVGYSGPVTLGRISEMNDLPPDWSANAVWPGESYRLPFRSAPVLYAVKPEFSSKLSEVRDQLGALPGVVAVDTAVTLSLVGSRPAECSGSGAAPDARQAAIRLAELLKRNAQAGGPVRKATVAVIDTGIDESESRLPLLESFEPENMIDDDGNGWIDDRIGVNTDRQQLGFPTTSSAFGDRAHGTHVAGLVMGGFLSPELSALARERIELRVINIVSKRTLRGADGAPTDTFVIHRDAVQSAFWYTRLDPDIPILHFSVESPDPLDTLEAALHTGEFLAIVAAGNGGQDLTTVPAYPAQYGKTMPDRLITVGAIDPTGALARFSNRGADFVDLVAPGCDVWSILPGESGGALSGTSQAAPQVTFAAAILYSEGFSIARVRDRLRLSAIPESALANSVRYGQFDAVRALSIRDDIVSRTGGEPSHSGRLTAQSCAQVARPCGSAGRYQRTANGAVLTTYTRDGLSTRPVQIPEGDLTLITDSGDVALPWSDVTDILFALKRG